MPVIRALKQRKRSSYFTTNYNFLCHSWLTKHPVMQYCNHMKSFVDISLTFSIGLFSNNSISVWRNMSYKALVSLDSICGLEIKCCSYSSISLFLHCAFVFSNSKCEALIHLLILKSC